MNMDGKEYEEKTRAFVYSAAFCAAVLVIALLCGCSHRTYVPLQSVRTDTVYMARKDSVHVKDSLVERQVVNIRDSVAVHDSVVIVKDERGDVKERLIVRYRDRWHASTDNMTLRRQLDRYRAQNDSLRAARRDSVAVPVPVEKKLTKWQKFKMDVGGWAIGAMSAVLIAACAYVLMWLARKRRLV